MPKLIILHPDGEPKTVELEDSATIGRSPDVTVTVDDVACSRRHCQILKIASGYELVDMKSRNGTKVNGVKRNRHVLSDGDIVEIGDTRITFREREGDEEEVVLEDFGGGDVSTDEDCYLVFADDDRKGERVPLSESRVTFGRKDSNTVVLKDAMASSYHCEITREGGGYLLRDLGSTNGSIVNGEPVSETTLGHGARIRIGKTRFVFVDPAVEGFEQAIAAEEEQEAEWGLMRAQVDLARVKKARRASLMWLGLFVVVVGGGAAVFATQPDLVKGLFGMEETVSIREVAGNRIDADDFSFENPGFPWIVPEDQPGDVDVVRGVAHQGSKALNVTGTEEGPVPSIARMGRDIPVVSGQQYEISAWVKTAAPGTLARAGVLWRSVGGGGVDRYAFTPFVEEGGWNRVSAVVTAPPRADQCRFVACVIGPGSAHFDDVVLKKAVGARPGIETQEKSGFDLLVTESGVISIERTGRFLLWNGGFAGVTPEGGLAAHPFLARGDSGFALPGGGTVDGGVTVTPTSEGFTVTVRVAEGAEGLEAAGLGFAVARGYLSEGATISGPEGAIEVQADTDAENVEKVILGGVENRLSIVAEGGARFRMISTPHGLWMVLTRSPAAGESTYTIVADFSSQRQVARSLLGDARAAQVSGSLGGAVRLFTRVVDEFPFDPAIRQEALSARDAILEKGEERVATARALYEAAKGFHDTRDLRAALELAERTGADFMGYAPITDETTALAADIRTALGEELSARSEARAARLELRAADFERRGQKNLSRLFYSRIVELYPETETAERARAKLK